MASTASDLAPADDGSASADDLRRLDWRFLLPDVEFDEVACMAAPGGTLAAALRAVCPSVVDLTDPCAQSGRLVVVERARLASLAMAADAVSPGGWLYAEFTRNPRSLKDWLCHPARCRRALARRGFDRVVAAWHRPDFARGVEIVPLDGRAAGVFTMSRAAVSWKRRLQIAIGRFLARTGLLPFVVPCFSVVGRKTPQ